MTARKEKQLGFTLVELAVVLMIIGLLVGGVLRGQELVQDARIKATIRQITSYDAAMASFQDTYYQLPGDMSLALSRLPNCTTSSTYCNNGNGDSIIAVRLAAGNSQAIQTGPAMPQVETTLFWKHLSLAHLISGINAAADPASPVIGQTHPAAKSGGVFMVAQGMHIGTAREGIMLVLSNTLTDNGTGAIQGAGRDPLTPREAHQFDVKMDDGRPDNGSVSAPDHNQTCDNGQAYHTDGRADQKGCILVFQLR